MVRSPYRSAARDVDAELASLVACDGLARALSAHRRRAMVGLACGVLGLFVVVRGALAVEDLSAKRRFEAAHDMRAVAAPREVRVEAHALRMTSPAVREQDAPPALLRCSFVAAGDPLAPSEPSCLWFAPQRID